MQIQKLPAGRGWAWFKESWQIYKRDPLMWSATSLIYVVLICAMSAVPIFGSVACMVLTPVLSAGLFLCCHSLAMNGKFDVGGLFAGFQEKRFKDILLFGVVGMALLLLLVFIVLIVSSVVAISVYSSVGGLDSAVEVGKKFFGGDFQALGATNLFLILGLGFFASMTGLIGYAFIWMATWLVVPIMIFQNQDLSSAMKLSYRVSMANMGAVLVYGLAFFFWFFAASLVFGLGLFVFGPVVLITQYVSYRELVGPISRVA